MLNKLSGKARLLILFTLVVVAVGVWALLSSGRQLATPAPTQTPTPIPSPTISPEDLKLVTRLSEELAQKFNTYRRPDEPSYLASIKPYLDAAFYKTTAAEINRYRGRLTNVDPISARVDKPHLQSSTPTEAVLTVVVHISEGSKPAQSETAEIKWVKRGERWIALYILNSDSEQNREKFNADQ